MPRLMVLNKYEDALIATYDFEGEMDTESGMSERSFTTEAGSKNGMSRENISRINGGSAILLASLCLLPLWRSQKHK